MQKKSIQGITLEELSMYQGFEELTQGELEEALQFIQVMTELLHTIIMK
jgi:hypothetical protein